MSGRFCQVCAELAHEGTLGILQFPQCCRGLHSELCKHVVSYWSLSGGGQGKEERKEKEKEGQGREREKMLEKEEVDRRNALKLKVQAINTIALYKKHDGNITMATSPWQHLTKFGKITSTIMSNIFLLQSSQTGFYEIQALTNHITVLYHPIF